MCKGLEMKELGKKVKNEAMDRNPGIGAVRIATVKTRIMGLGQTHRRTTSVGL